MRIKNVELERLDLKLTEPYTIAYETVDKALNYLLRIQTDQGDTGFGISSPDSFITGENPESIEASFKNFIQPILKGENPYYNTRIIHDLTGKIGASALAMVDMALLDLMSRKAELPLFQYLGAFRSKISTSITIGILPENQTIKKVDDFVKQGFKIVKLKGGLKLEEDISKIKKLRKKYPDLVLRFDGNQGFSLEEALYFVEAIKDEKVEIVEQPTKVKKESLMGIINQKSLQPIMADESIKSLTDAFFLTSNGYTDMINIKIQKVGGIQNAVQINAVARAASNEVMVGCLDECGLGISAGLHFALSRPNVHFADLDGHLDIENDPFRGLFQLKNGILYPGNNPGLGRN